MSVLVVSIIAATLTLLFVAPYLIYPLVLRGFGVRGRPAGGADVPAGQGALPRVSVLIPAHNEAQHMRFKLNNTLNLDYPPDRLEVIVCSDGSSDTTDDIVRSFSHRGVKLLRNMTRRGKATALNRLVEASNGQILLMSDASAALQTDTLRKLVRALDDPAVGAAASRYVVRSGDAEGAAGETEAGYWTFESRMREAEAARDMLLGASGAGLVLRRDLWEPLPIDTVNDDYILPLRIRGAGHRIAYVAGATATETPTTTSQTLYHRWVRIAFGNYQMFWRHRRYFNPGRPRMAIPLMRKLLRTCGPLLLLALAAVISIASPQHEVFAVLAVTGWGLLLISIAAVALRNTVVGHTRALRVLQFCLLAQTAYLHGCWRWIVGASAGIWRRPGESPALQTPAEIPITVRFVKRSLDVVGAIVGLAVFSPFMVIIAIAIKLDSRGPVLYVQPRMRPSHGTQIPFNMIKFRSMKKDAEEKTGPVWASTETMARVTRVGRVIRRFRLDEVPQFINVLKGDMSLVGPRPERPFFTVQLSEQIPAYDDRLSVIKPGITGWAQVQRPADSSVDSVKDKVLHDLVYLAHMYRLSTYLTMEARVLWRTVFVMLGGKGR